MPELMLHQKKALLYLGSRRSGALLMEMRLGKTFTIISHIQRMNIRKVLIVCPYSVIDSWGKEFEKAEVDCNSLRLLKGTKNKRLLSLSEVNNDQNVKWCVSNFESIERLNVHTYNWDAVIIDESVKIANPKAKVTKYCINKLKFIKHKYILCGNAAPENELQYVTQYIFLFGSFMGFKNYWSFRNTKYVQSMYNWEALPGVKKEIIKYIHRNSFVLTRKEAGIGSVKFYQTRTIETNVAQRAQYKAMKLYFEFGTRKEMNTLGQCISLSRIAGGCSCESPHHLISENKFNEIMYLLRGELKNQKVLIWCRFKAEAYQITRRFDEKGIGAILITGDVKDSARAQYKAEFENQGNIQVAVLTIASCAKGQDWSVADTAIYYNNEYSNDLRSQSEDRMCHPKKKTPLLIIDLLSDKTIDVKVHQLLKDKHLTSKMFMNKLIASLKD